MRNFSDLDAIVVLLLKLDPAARNLISNKGNMTCPLRYGNMEDYRDIIIETINIQGTPSSNICIPAHLSSVNHAYCRLVWKIDLWRGNWSGNLFQAGRFYIIAVSINP